MSDIDLQFEEFMKESLSTDESPETNSSPKQTDVTTKLPEPRTFWWMKPNVPAEPVSHRSSLSSTSIDEKLDSPQLEGNYVPISASPKSASMKSQKNASPDISSSMAEFLEKEKICKELSSSISEVDSPGMDLDDVTDDDIGSIMEQLSQLAGSGDDSAADKSVEEILKEAEDLVRETSHSFSALTDGRELLRVPMTPELVVKGQAADLLPAPLIKSKSKKSGEFYRDKRSSRSSSAPPTARKIGEIAKGKGGRISGTKSSYTLRPTDIYENSNIDNSFRQSSLSTADGINTNTHAFSHGSSKIKDIPRKEKTVTFNENFIPLETAGTSVLNTHISSQIVQDAHKILPDELETYSDEGNRTSLVANSTSHNEVPSRRRQMTEIVSLSPPLIQHGDVVGTPEAIFQLIDDEVRNEIAAALKESSISINDKEKNSNSSEPENGTVSIEEDMAKNIDDNRNNVPALETVNSAGTSLRRQPLPVVLEESSISEASSEPKTKKSNIMTENSHSKDISVQVTDSTLIEQIESLKEELQQERNKIVHYKDQLSNEEQERKKQLDSLKCKHEEEMFEVKKEVYMLNAKIGDLEKQQMSSADKGSGVDDAATERRIALLEGELQQQEQLMLGYQRENVKLCQDMKQLREEIKTKEQKFADEKQQLISSRQDHEVERLTERLKDKDEVIVKLQIEIQGLKDKVAEFECVTDELETSNKVLKAELEKYKRAASKTTVTPVKTTARNQDVDRYREELAKREREVDEIHKELHLAQSNLVTSKAALSEQQLQVGELETKVSELQIALTKEHAQNREHVLRNEEDKKIIRDLNRQVKEMERILRRHHPNSISALILTANSESADSGSGQTPRVKFLENRVQQLEQELEKSETESKTKMQEIQNKLLEMKVKYEEHTSDLELQLATAKHQSHMWRQAAEKNETKASPESKPEHQPVRETKQMKKLLPPPMVIAVGAPPANALAVREDAHLVATIRGLKQELVLKERELSKIRRELDEIAKTNRRLQRERERQLGIVAAPPRPPAVRGPPRDEHSSESSQRSSTKVYEVVSPPEYQENISKLEQENGKLRQELLCLEEEYRSLQTKRLEDLNLLQEEHEAEIDHLISDHMIRNSNPHISDLQNQLRTQQSLLDHLKEQLRQSDVYREELELLRVERVHLEQSNMELHKKLADLRNLMTPEMIQYEAMQEKLSELERRHEVREQKLQAMVKDLLRRNAEQRALSGDDSNATTMREKLLDKNRQLCLYRAEIDRILDTLREFNRHKKPGNAVS